MVFDLKGSTFKRNTKGKITKSTILKDLDFVQAKKQSPQHLNLDKINQVLVKTLRRDVHFLKLHGLLDYSLLLAIEKDDEKFNKRRVYKERI